MAWALTLLETGQPPSDPYSCRMEPQDGCFFVVTFTTTQATPLTYRIDILPAAGEDNGLPYAPPNFIGGRGRD